MGRSEFNGEEIPIDLGASYSTDYFSFNYPEEWHIQQESGSDEHQMVQIIDQEIPQEAEHFIWVYYSIDIENYYYETEEYFYANIDDVLKNLKESPDVDILYSNQLTLDDKPAHRVRYNLEDDYIFDLYFVYENQHQHNIIYYTEYGEFNINLVDAFFDSLEFK